MKRKSYSAYTLSELIITIIVLAGMVSMLLGFSNIKRQQDFDNKINNTIRNLSVFINKSSSKNYTNSEIYTPEMLYTEILQKNDVLAIEDSECLDNSCWGENFIGGENLLGLPKILLKDGTAVAFGEKNIFIDANGLAKPNVFGKDIKKWDKFNK